MVMAETLSHSVLQTTLAKLLELGPTDNSMHAHIVIQ